jgi:hypothetical protein
MPTQQTWDDKINATSRLDTREKKREIIKRCLDQLYQITYTLQRLDYIIKDRGELRSDYLTVLYR